MPQVGTLRPVDFLFPAGLALGALSVPLVALYFLRIRRRKVTVSSLLPWHALRRSDRLASPIQRFRKHLLLWLQLLLLLALVLAFARPYLETEAAPVKSVVLVIDTSGSMGATDLSPNRLRWSIDAATEILDGLSPGDEALVLTGGHRTEVRAAFTRDHGEARRALQDIELSQAEGSLDEALRLALSLARSRPDVEVVVLSDGGNHDLSSVATGSVAVRYVRAGRDSGNAGIVALDLRRSPVSDRIRELFVTVRRFGDTAVAGSVEVYLDGELIGLRTETLPTDAPVSMVFEIDGDAAGDLQVKLAADDDALPADDTAWAVLTQAAAREVLVVGGDKLLSRILTSDPRATTRRVSPTLVTPELLASADCVIFAGAVPDGVDGLNYAVLGAGHGGPATLGDPQPAPRVVGWQRTHPLLRFTRWDDLIVGQSRPVLDPGGLAPIVDSDLGALVLAGERGGGRVVQLTFDPLKSNLPLRVAWPVFVLNTVSWLTEGQPGAHEARQIPTGHPFVYRLAEADAASTASGTGPKGRVDAQVADGVLRVTDTDQVGIYDISAGGFRTRFATNLVSERETRIRPRAQLGLGSESPIEATAALATGRRELWRPLLWLALLVLMLEWVAYHRRRAS